MRMSYGSGAQAKVLSAADRSLTQTERKESVCVSVCEQLRWRLEQPATQTQAHVHMHMHMQPHKHACLHSRLLGLSSIFLALALQSLMFKRRVVSRPGRRHCTHTSAFTYKCKTARTHKYTNTQVSKCADQNSVVLAATSSRNSSSSSSSSSHTGLSLEKQTHTCTTLTLEWACALAGLGLTRPLGLAPNVALQTQNARTQQGADESMRYRANVA